MTDDCHKCGFVFGGLSNPWLFVEKFNNMSNEDLQDMNNKKSLEETIDNLKQRLEKLNAYEAAANFKGGYQPCIDEYSNILVHLEGYAAYTDTAKKLYEYTDDVDKPTKFT